jgi:hypothetical protein
MQAPPSRLATHSPRTTEGEIGPGLGAALLPWWTVRNERGLRLRRQAGISSERVAGGRKRLARAAGWEMGPHG